MILKGKEAKEKLLKGLNDTADVVKSTLGLRGKTVMICDPFGIGHDITKDGAKVARAINIEDKFEKSGSEFIKKSATKTEEEAGDATTSTTILTQSLCNDIFREIELGSNPNQISKDLKEDLEKVVKYIQEKSKKVESTKDIFEVAKVSANNDYDIAKLIQNIYDDSNLNVAIDIVESDDLKDSYEIVKGFTMRNTGYTDSIFVNNPEKSRIEFNNPRVYLYNGKIKFMNQDLMNIFMDNADRNNPNFRPTVLIVESIEEAPFKEIRSAFQQEMIHSIAIVESGLIFDNRKSSFIDSSKFLDAEYNESKIGFFGECEKIIIEKNSTTFINGKGDVKKHLQDIKKIQKKDPKNIGLKQRVFDLESVAAIIKVGGKLVDEIGEKKDRIEDAVYAVKSAIEEGYSPGASSVYLSALKNLDIKTQIMKNALLSVYNQLMKNAELEPQYYLREIHDKDFPYGYNLLTNQVSDLIKDGILDSSKALRVSLENAVHTALIFSTINATVS